MEEESRGDLMVLRCTKCEKLYYPPRYTCSECGGNSFRDVSLLGNGEVYSYATIRVPFEELMPEAPLALAQIVVEEGLVVPGRIFPEQREKVEIGHKVAFIKCEKGINWFRLTY